MSDFFNRILNFRTDEDDLWDADDGEDDQKEDSIMISDDDDEVSYVPMKKKHQVDEPSALKIEGALSKKLIKRKSEKTEVKKSSTKIEVKKIARKLTSHAEMQKKAQADKMLKSSSLKPSPSKFKKDLTKMLSKQKPEKFETKKQAASKSSSQSGIKEATSMFDDKAISDDEYDQEIGSTLPKSKQRNFPRRHVEKKKQRFECGKKSLAFVFFE